MNYYSIPPRSDELFHYGVRGMKWGVRRYQNDDGTLTNREKKRYDYRDSDQYQKGDSETRQRLTNQYNTAKRRIFGVGKKRANRLMYNYLERGKDYNKEYMKEAGKKAATNLGVSAALNLGSKYAMKRLTTKVNSKIIDAAAKEYGYKTYAGPSMGSRAKTRMRNTASSMYNRARSMKNRSKNRFRRKSNALTVYRRQGPTWISR